MGFYLIQPKKYSPRTSTNTNLNMAESENIGANHLGFAKSLFQQYNQQLGLNSNHYPAESAFNFYVNNKITECLGGTVNIEAARENFYTELFQHINLPKNYSFASIIREINQTIKKYTQQQFPITYADKGKRKIQTPAATLKRIQLLSWKKHRVESPTTLSYHYTPGSAINISSAHASTSNATSTFGRFQNLITNIPTRFRSHYSMRIIRGRRRRKKFRKCNSEYPNTTKPEQINQNNLPPNIAINQPPINPIAKSIQQPLQLPPQQNQQPFQQPPQPLNLDSMVYVPIAKLDNFTSKEDDTQVWLNNVEKAITANR
ncbi:hypothetical protein G9A89_005918 [Geosiphon pyriformis]|nr:hypothetical protein G9A89_005918 [Geosiphon pyriformis]